MKKIVSILTIFFVIIMCLCVLTGCSKKEDKVNENNTVQSVALTWPDMTFYDIPNLTKGKIEDVNNMSNQNGYELNYEIEVSSIKKSDIEEYCKKYDEDWNNYEENGATYLTKVDKSYSYSVYIEYNEEDKSATFTISLQ